MELLIDFINCFFKIISYKPLISFFAETARKRIFVICETTEKRVRRRIN